MAKGSGFERDIAKRLSLWWSYKTRDDLIWRTAGSGARATTRGKKNQKTSGHYGDLTYTDPEAKPLFDCLTIECKKGYSTKTLADLADKRKAAKQQIWEKWILTADRDHKAAGSMSWAIISMRNYHIETITIPRKFIRELPSIGIVPRLRIDVKIGETLYRLHQIPFAEFLEIDPEVFTEMVKWR